MTYAPSATLWAITRLVSAISLVLCRLIYSILTALFLFCTKMSPVLHFLCHSMTLVKGTPIVQSATYSGRDQSDDALFISSRPIQATESSSHYRVSMLDVIAPGMRTLKESTYHETSLMNFISRVCIFLKCTFI